MYLTAIIDIYSRYIVGWQISNSLEKGTQTEVLTDATARHGKPEVINSYQGSQYTCANWLDYLKESSIKVSMDGKGRATNNAFIERFFRTLKWKHIYLYPAKDEIKLYEGVNRFMNKYNKRRHREINRERPSQTYQQEAQRIDKEQSSKKERLHQKQQLRIR